MAETSIEEKVVKRLREKNLMISFAESITGGMLASTIINVSGSSNVIHESYVTYSNDVKCKVLKVNKETIDKYSVVSEEVVKEMVEGLYNITNSNVCVCVSGYAETDIPNQGNAWYSIRYTNINKKEITKFTIVTGNRNEVRKKVTDEILNNVYELIGEE